MERGDKCERSMIAILGPFVDKSACPEFHTGQSSRKRRTLLSLLKRYLTLLGCILLALSLVATAQDKKTCSNASLRGSFGLRATGNTTTGGALIVMGRFSFDGNGNLTATLFTRTPTAATTLDTYTGTYSVDSNCFVTDSWVSDSTGSVTTHVSVLVNESKGYYVLNTTQGAPVIISGEAQRQ